VFFNLVTKAGMNEWVASVFLAVVRIGGAEISDCHFHGGSPINKNRQSLLLGKVLLRLE